MKPRILFLCTGNSARSQMAEGLLRSMAGERFEALSAGTHPVGLNSIAVQAMRELGIDISGQRSKLVDEFVATPIQTVVTVCDRANAECPIFPGAGKRIAWSFEDPADISGNDEEKLAAFRRIRDQIASAIREEFTPEKQP